MGARILRADCDALDLDDPQRLCWHTNDDSDWRCGANVGLQGDAGWERVVMQRSANVPIPLAAPGAALEFAGSIDASDALFRRARENCTPKPTAEYHYDTFVVVNDTAVDQVIDVEAAWAGDGFLLLYRDPFAPEVAGQCIAGDDDFGARGSRVANRTIAPGQIVHIAATTFSAFAAIGPYTITVSTRPAP